MAKKRVVNQTVVEPENPFPELTPSGALLIQKLTRGQLRMLVYPLGLMKSSKGGYPRSGRR